MRRLSQMWLACGAVLVLPCASGAQVKQQGATAEAREGIDRSWQRLDDYARRGDFAGMASVYMRDGIVTDAGMHSYIGREAIRAAYQEGWGDQRLVTSQRHQLSLAMSGDVAVENGRLDVTIQAPGKPAVPASARYSEVWRHVGREWLLVSDVTMPMPDSTPAAPTATNPGSGCAVQGTWALESSTVDGKSANFGDYHQIKMVAGSHFTWVGQRPGPASLQTVADSLTAYRNTGFGGGSYRVTDSTYTERVEFFSDPTYVGRELTFSCRIVGGRWYHAGDLPDIENGREVGRLHLEEVWRRIE